MNKISIQQRPLSHGEQQALKRLQAYTRRREATITTRGGNGHTVVMKPPMTEYGSLYLAPDNQGV